MSDSESSPFVRSTTTRKDAEFMVESVKHKMWEWTQPLALGRPGNALSEIEVGSGVAVNVDGHYFLLTADHNVLLGRSGYRQVGLIPRGLTRAEDIRWFDDDRIIVSANAVTLLNLATDQRHTVTTDYSVFKLRPAEVEELGIECMNADQIGVRPLDVGEFCMVAGYPAAIYKRSDDQSTVQPFPFIFGTKAVDVAALGSNAHPLTHLAVAYPSDVVITIEPGKRQVAQLPRPHGISGCGVWALHPTLGGLFSYRDLRLSGIQYAVHEGSEVLHSCRMAQVIEAMCVTDPTVADYFTTRGFDRTFYSNLFKNAKDVDAG
ncbi:hypothetical protein L6R53_20470 [Myxococcota bacterium]|nr:hypothetical protein [Myxococcota bacterium]